MQNKLLTIAVVALVLIGGAVFVWQKKNSLIVSQNEVKNTDTKVVPEGWKAYRSEKYGFEIQYPKDWKISETIGDITYAPVVSLLSPETQKFIDSGKMDGYCDISFYYSGSLKEKIDNSQKAGTIEEYLSQNDMVLDIRKAKMGGLDAYEATFGGNGAYYGILTLKDSHVYEGFSCRKATYEQLNSTEKQIMESFKFIEADQN